MSKDYYEILGISKSASESDIKSAYRKMAREWHPDVAKDKPDAEERFKEINEAYQVLGDPQKRSQYDQFGTTFNQQGGSNSQEGFNPFGSGFGPFTWSYQSYGGDQQRDDFQDPFDIFEQVFGFRGFGGPKRGRNLRYTLSIDFIDSIKGYEEVIDVNGHKLKIKLPPGVDDGMTVKFSGKGEKIAKGGEPGDLLITIHVTSHPHFIRQNNDIFSDIEINLKTAILGGKIDIDIVDPKSKTGFSKKQLKIPSGTQPGTIFKVRGFGMPHPKGYGRGDHYVTIKVTVPKSLTKQQKDALVNYF